MDLKNGGVSVNFFVFVKAYVFYKIYDILFVFSIFLVLFFDRLLNKLKKINFG